MNISSLIHPVLPVVCTPTILPYTPILDTSDAVASCWKEVTKAIQMISACPFSKAFWEEVHEEGEFSIQCLPAEVLKHPASVYPDRREIQLSTFQPPGIPVNMIHNVLFELNNLKQAKRLIDVQRFACSTNAVDFSKSIESIEYITDKNTNNLFGKCAEQGFWNPDGLAILFQNELSEEESLNMQIRLGHTSGYQLSWYRSCDPEGVCVYKHLLRQLEPHGIRLPHAFYADDEPNTLEELISCFMGGQFLQKRQVERQKASAAHEFSPVIEEASQDWWSQTKDAIAQFARAFFA